MENWKKIWEKLGKQKTNDVRLLNGYGHTKANHTKMAGIIMKALKIKESDRVLEVGCGAGALAQHIAPHCKYVGTDLSKSLLKRHQELLGNRVIHAPADKLPFPDKYFDKVFCFGVFHYFPDLKYAQKVLEEMQRVSKGTIYLGDLPLRSKRKSHLLFRKENFSGYKITKGLYQPNTPYRFNVLIPNPQEACPKIT